jgi:hypothetical protein
MKPEYPARAALCLRLPEVFHALVIAAAALQYAAIPFFVLPGARE